MNLKSARVPEDGLSKQRSLNLLDKDFKLLTDYAARLGATNSFALARILRQTLGGEPPEPQLRPLDAAPSPRHEEMALD